MEAVKEGLIEQALATAVLDKGNAELQEALLAVLWERKQPELYERALEQVRQEQQVAEGARQERWQAQKAQARRALAQEAEQLIAEGIQQGMADDRQRLRAQRDEWKAHATVAEAWIVEHVKELLPHERRVLLRDPEITTFRLHTLNLLLSRFGLEVRARLTDTPQVVACEVGPQRWEQRSRFRLTTITPTGVKDETADEDEDAGAQVEASQESTVN
jgi:hypothetical protein